ncbi:MAG: trimeric intracellular cation channel family protein [Acidimicrobiia bacterium]
MHAAMTVELVVEQLVDATEEGTGFATVERGLELLGLFVFAISGAMLGVRKGFEVVGITSLALVTALGGGVVRDLVLGDTPPLAFRDVWYLVVPLVAAAVVFVAHSVIDRQLHRSVLVFDAIGLGLFSATGAVKAASYGTTAVGAVVLAVVTAAGGGILRDVLANDTPQIFHPDSRLYAIPAAGGATILVVLVRNDAYSGVVAAVVAAGVCLVRLASLRWGWRAPMPRPARG